MSSLMYRLTRVAARALAETPVRLAVFALLALATAWPLLATGDQLNLFRDAHIHFVYERAAVTAVKGFGQPPLWDPTYCGGIYALGSPQIRFTSPTFLLSLLFGVPRGEALAGFFMLVVGLEGTYRYARSYGAGALGAALAAPVYGLSGVFAAAPFLGWVTFYSFGLLPFAAWGMRRALRGRPSGVLVTAVAGAWILGLGGTYSAPMTGLFCAYEVALAAWRSRRSPAGLARVAGMTALAALLTLGLAALRLWPVMETLARAPRVLGGKPGTPLDQILAALVEPVRVRAGNIADRRMYFVGVVAAPALLAGLPRRRIWPLVVMGGLALWAATGYATGWSPFVGLKRLPVFSALRYPERYLILVALVLAMVSAVGVRTLEALARRRRWWAIPLVAVAAALVANTVSLVSDHHVVAGKRLLAPAAPTLDREFHQARGNRWAVSYYPAMSRGSISCMDAYPVPESAKLRGDLAAEEYLAGPAAGTVARRHWSPLRIDLAVELARPARLYVNQNYHPGWRASVGQVADDDGLLAVDLPAGRHDLRLRFVPRSAVGGAAVSLAALAVLIWIGARARRRDDVGGRRQLRVYLGAALVPLAVAALARAAIREAPMPPTPARAPSGEPILTLVDRPTEGAAEIGAALADGVTIVAARAQRSASVPRGAILELDLRVDGRPREGTAVVVQADSDAGERLRFDHLLLSAWTDLAHAPRGRLVRDFVPLPVGRGTRGTRWTIRVGLKSRRGAVLPVHDPGRARADDDLVEVAAFSLAD
jgi:hypothetical protein